MLNCKGQNPMRQVVILRHNKKSGIQDAVLYYES